MIDRLHNLLLRRGRPVLRATSLDEDSLGDSMDTIEEEVIAKCRMSTGERRDEDRRSPPLIGPCTCIFSFRSTREIALK
jgi:hypothetical protein